MASTAPIGRSPTGLAFVSVLSPHLEHGAMDNYTHFAICYARIRISEKRERRYAHAIDYQRADYRP